MGATSKSIGIMNPDIPAPDCTTDEISVVVGDAEVVDGGKFIGWANLGDFDQLVVTGYQKIADLKLPSRYEFFLRGLKNSCLLSTR